MTHQQQQKSISPLNQATSEENNNHLSNRAHISPRSSSATVTTPKQPQSYVQPKCGDHAGLIRRRKFFGTSHHPNHSPSSNGEEELSSSASGGFLTANTSIKYLSVKTPPQPPPLKTTTPTATPPAPAKTLSQELAEELEVTKDVLLRHNVPLNRRIIKVVYLTF